MIASVIISTHNRREGLTELLDDLAAQDYDPEQFEVLVINSLQGEDVADLVKKYALQGRKGRQIMANNVLASKRNAGARQSSGELLIFLDDDLRISSTFVSEHVAAHREKPALVSGQIVFPEEWVSERNYYRYKNSRHFNVQNGMTNEMTILPHRVVAMNCSMSADAFEQVGGFNENFIHYGGEDVEFGFHCARLGYMLLYSPGPIGVHQEVQGNVSSFARRIYAASLMGTDLLLSTTPTAAQVPTFRWTDPGVATRKRDKAIYHALSLVSSHWLLGQILRALESTDQVGWLYTPIVYKGVTLMATRLGSGDRRSGRDRRETIGSRRYHREELQGEISTGS